MFPSERRVRSLGALSDCSPVAGRAIRQHRARAAVDAHQRAVPALARDQAPLSVDGQPVGAGRRLRIGHDRDRAAAGIVAVDLRGGAVLLDHVGEDQVAAARHPERPLQRHERDRRRDRARRAHGDAALAGRPGGAPARRWARSSRTPTAPRRRRSELSDTPSRKTIGHDDGHAGDLSRVVRKGEPARSPYAVLRVTADAP